MGGTSCDSPARGSTLEINRDRVAAAHNDSDPFGFFRPIAARWRRRARQQFAAWPKGPVGHPGWRRRRRERRVPRSAWESEIPIRRRGVAKRLSRDPASVRVHWSPSRDRGGQESHTRCEMRVDKLGPLTVKRGESHASHILGPAGQADQTVFSRRSFRIPKVTSTSARRLANPPRPASSSRAASSGRQRRFSPTSPLCWKLPGVHSRTLAALHRPCSRNGDRSSKRPVSIRNESDARAQRRPPQQCVAWRRIFSREKYVYSCGYEDYPDLNSALENQ